MIVLIVLFMIKSNLISLIIVCESLYLIVDLGVYTFQGAAGYMKNYCKMHCKITESGLILFFSKSFKL